MESEWKEEKPKETEDAGVKYKVLLIVYNKIDSRMEDICGNV